MYYISDRVDGECNYDLPSDSTGYSFEEATDIISDTDDAGFLHSCKLYPYALITIVLQALYLSTRV